MDWLGDFWDAMWALPSGAWAAIAAWVTVAIAGGTVVVTGRYAKRQIEQAEQLREEQAQPNVVVLAESNSTHWFVLELVVKNFGSTPAYDVRVSFTPDLEVAPYTNLSTGEEVTRLRYPAVIPFLAPGQEWRTVWDSGIRRAEHRKEQGVSVRSRFDAKVVYRDSRNKQFNTASVLDWDSHETSTRVSVKTVHHVATVLDREMKVQNNELHKIRQTLKGFRSEHHGIWVYPADAEKEREYREAEKRADEESMRQFNERADADRAQLEAQESARSACPHSPATGQTDSPHSTEPTDPAAPESPTQDD